jgi:hypothetical protein
VFDVLKRSINARFGETAFVHEVEGGVGHVGRAGHPSQMLVTDLLWGPSLKTPPRQRGDGQAHTEEIG